MKTPSARSRRLTGKAKLPAKIGRAVVGRRAAIFRNGRNQAVRLPQDLKFPENVKEVQVRKQGDSILLSPVRPGWPSFFALEVRVPDDFLIREDNRGPFGVLFGGGTKRRQQADIERAKTLIQDMGRRANRGTSPSS